MAALGEPVSPECRSGLALFLRRGMWGWSRALTTDPAPDPMPHRSSLGMPEPDQHTVVVRLFAAMAMVRKERKER